MESTEEEFSSFTTKGRRTKRQRSLLAATASSSYRGSGGGDGGAIVVATAGGGGGGCSDNSYGSSFLGASPSDEHDVMSEVTATEEEDMANCLILLAQGIEKKVSKIIKSKTNHNNNTNNNTGTSTSNIGVYECKTCNKTFPSFQALGGHRTSHKKIKPAVPPARSPDTIDNHHDRDRDRDCDRDRNQVVDDDLDVIEFTSKKLFLVQPNENNNMNMINKARVHECSICGSEFPSGQALGGHMRRHRAGAPPTTAAHGRPMGAAAAAAVIDTGGPRNILSLDLNLPAPDDQDDQQIMVDDHMDTKFVHVLPTPAPLVDCHY